MKARVLSQFKDIKYEVERLKEDRYLGDSSQESIDEAYARAAQEKLDDLSKIVLWLIENRD